MVWFRNLIGKNQSVAVNAARLRFLAEIELCQGIFPSNQRTLSLVSAMISHQASNTSGVILKP